MLTDGILTLWLEEQNFPGARERYELERQVNPNGFMAQTLREEEWLRDAVETLRLAWSKFLQEPVAILQNTAPKCEMDYLQHALWTLLHLDPKKDFATQRKEHACCLGWLQLA